MALIQIGRLGRPHGLHGEVNLDGAALTPDELRAIESFTWQRPGTEPRPLRLESARQVTGSILIRFAGVEDRDQASALTLGLLYAERERLPDPGPDVAYTFQLIGLEVVSEDGRRLGVVQGVLDSGAHPIYVVQGDKELLVPAIPQVLRRVDLKAGRITVVLPAGLEDL